MRLNQYLREMREEKREEMENEMNAVLPYAQSVARDDTPVSRRARCLVALLLNQLGLYPSSDEMSNWFEDYEGYDNQSILEVWVQAQLDDEVFEFSGHATTAAIELMRRLSHRLAMRDAANDDDWSDE